MDLSKRLPRLAAVTALLGLSLALPPAAGAQLSEYEMKAAFLYNFTKFIQWPADSYEGPRSPLVIGVLGTDPFGNRFDEFLRGKTVSGRSIVVRRAMTLAKLGKCQLLFVSRSEESHYPELLGQLDSMSVVTVGDSDDFIASGGMIQLGLVENRVRFAISSSRAERVGVRISSRVLNLSRITVSRR